MPIIDQTRTYKDLEAKALEVSNPRHRAMVEKVLQHARGEVEEDLDAVMATLSPHPVYRVWSNPDPAMNPEGWETVRQYYIHQIFGRGLHCLESTKERIHVTDDAVITEGMLRTVMWGRDLREMGTAVDDPEGYYLVTYRMLITWPFDENGLIKGEESYSARGADYLTKITEADLPDSFKAYVSRRKQQDLVKA